MQIKFHQLYLVRVNGDIDTCFPHYLYLTKKYVTIICPDEIKRTPAKDSPWISGIIQYFKTGIDIDFGNRFSYEEVLIETLLTDKNSLYRKWVFQTLSQEKEQHENSKF